MSKDGKGYLFDNPRNIRLVVRSLAYACILLFAADFLVHRHLSHPLEELFGFYAIYGFVSCVLLVLLAAEMRKLVMRDEDFYEHDGEAVEAPDGAAAGSKEDDGNGHA